MADPINLRTFRKKKQRREKEEQAEKNRMLFGLSKEARQAAATEKSKQKTRLDGHKIIPDEDG